MSLTIPVAHDFICPWCWIGFFQAKDLEKEFAVKIDWLSYELMPDAIPWGEPTPIPELEPDRPKTPSRIELAYEVQGMERPTAQRPKRMRSHNAHEATLFAKEHGQADEVVEILYRAYWERGEEINSPLVLARLLKDVVDTDAMLDAIAERRYAEQIIPFDEAAYASGVYYVPTFFIGDARLAEDTYKAIRGAMQKLGVRAVR